MALDGEDVLDLNFAPSIVEAGGATYPIGYVSLISKSTGEPALATSNMEVGLLSTDASVAFVPSRVVIPAGSDYARFDVEVSDLTGEVEISALYGNQKVSRTFKVVDAVSLVENINLVINLASDKMQIDSQMPFSVYLEKNGNILQAPQDITVEFDYESSLVKLGSDSVVIEKGDYYAVNTIKTLQQSGNAFIKATSDAGTNGQLNTVTNVAISQTQPVSLKVYVFPDKVGLNENTIDIFVGVLDTAGQPTLAAEDINLDLFSSAYQLTGIDDVPAVIKKGEFGFYTRQYMNFYSNHTVTVGASAPGLGAGTASFEVLQDSLSMTHPKALDKVLQVFTIETMPSDADSIIVYQLNAIEHDNDDCAVDEEVEGEEATNCIDITGDGQVDENDWHPIDDLDEGDLYPLEVQSIFSQSQGNLNVVSGDNLAASVFSFGYLSAGSSYGTATILSGRQADDVEFSVSLANVAVGSNSISIVGGLNPTQTKIFSPAGLESDGNYRMLFDREGYSDLYFITIDSAGRPSSSPQGIKYLIKPVNELTQIKPEMSFASLRVKTSSFNVATEAIENTIGEISAVPVGVNSDSNLEATSSMHLLFHTGTAAKVLLPFDSMVAFTKEHQIGVLQLSDASGNPVIASDDITIKLTSSSLSSVLPASTVTISKGKSFASFEVATFGRADNFTIYAAADGLQPSSVALTPVVAELPASFVGASTFTTSTPTGITVSTPIEGVDVTWGALAGLQLLDNESSFRPAGNSYTATMQVVAESPGTFMVDATLLKDGFKPTRISKEISVVQYMRSMNAVLLDNGFTMLAYNHPTLMQVSVNDANGVPVQGALVQVEDTGPQGMMLVTSAATDASGIASFIYTPTQKSESNFLTLIVTASKDGYQPSRDSKIFDVDSSTAFLPPLPVLGAAFAGLPSWTSYIILGGAVVVGGGLYLLKKPMTPEDDEPLVVEDAGTTETPAEETLAEGAGEDLLEDDEEET